MSKQKILLVDDEKDITEMIAFNLEREGYEVFSAHNGTDALNLASSVIPDLIVLDVMMPGMDGIEICRELREKPALRLARIALLTARSEDYSQIAGFEAGADDYIAKPIKPRVLISRIRALLRREPLPGVMTSGVNAGGLVIDREGYRVIQGNRQLVLPKKEFELLALLTSAPGRVFTRENILSMVWGNDVVVGDRTIDVHIRKLREKLGESSFRTVKGVGYTFEP